jgi:hypothetical protein
MNKFYGFKNPTFNRKVTENSFSVVKTARARNWPLTSFKHRAINGRSIPVLLQYASSASKWENIQLKLPCYSNDETSVIETLCTDIQTLTDHPLFILINLLRTVIKTSIPVAARSEGVGHADCRMLGLRVRILPAAWISVSGECCVLSDRGLCDGLIPYHDICVTGCDQMQQ